MKPGGPEDSGHELLTRHLTQTLHVLLWLFIWVSRDCLQLRTVLCMPLFVLLLTFGSVCRASTICCHVKCFHFVHIVVVHTALGEDILAPSTPLPIAALVGTWSKLSVALLQVRGEHSCPLPADDLEVAEETVLDVLAILKVEAMRRITLDGVARVHPQPLGNEDRIWVHLDCVVCLVHSILRLHLQPHLIEQAPIHPTLGFKSPGTTQYKSIMPPFMDAMELPAGQPQQFTKRSGGRGGGVGPRHHRDSRSRHQQPPSSDFTAHSIIDTEKLKRMDDLDNGNDWTYEDDDFDYNKKLESDEEEASEPV